jgi:hypothetical protein
MIDLAALGVWFRPKVVRFESLLDAEEEQVVRRLRAKGHELHWVLETRLHQLKRDGWKPVTQWDNTGRRSIFMDHREEIVLLHKRPAKTNKLWQVRSSFAIIPAITFACLAKGADAPGNIENRIWLRVTVPIFGCRIYAKNLPSASDAERRTMYAAFTILT